MRTVINQAEIDEQLCTGCDLCVRVCPSMALTLRKVGGKGLAVLDDQKCVDCKLCFTRCPTHAISMVPRSTPLQLGDSIEATLESAIEGICTRAHMYPEQVVCYCHRVQAREIAAAILAGAHTPEDLSLATGARTGCGVLCITGVIRLLRAAGVSLTKAPGYQWYGVKASIWDVPAEVREKYPQYRVSEDLEAINALFPSEREAD